MRISGMTMRRGFAGVVAAGALAGLTGAVAMPTAAADADCTVSGLSNAIGTVGAQTGDWFAKHPEANKAVTEAGNSGNAEG
ncbi:MAG TPA: hemophore-related protein, partial [Mycobacterium sp.]|nr:hemophore-related protein [Mycobacterium sp.]